MSYVETLLGRTHQIDSHNSVKYTAEFAGKMVEAILQKGVQNQYNIIVEGTFRRAQTPLDTLRFFKEYGYSTHVLIQTCSKKVSLESCLEHYNKMLKINPKEARYTPQEHHDLVCKNLAKNILQVYESNLANTFRIYIRNQQAQQEIFFDSTQDGVLKVDLLDKIINEQTLCH